MAAVRNFMLSTMPMNNGKIPNSANTAQLRTTTSTPTVTFTNGSPNIGGTFNTTNVTRDSRVTFTTTGTLPTNFSTGTTYYVVSISSTQMQVSASLGGTAISAGSAGSGTHTATIVQINQVWMIFVPPVSITCTKTAFFSTASTGLTVSNSLRASIQTVTTTTRGFAESGRPTGTLVGTGATVTTNLLNTTGWNEISGLSATLVAGTPYALVLEPTAAWTATVTINAAINETSTNQPFTEPGWYGGQLRETAITGFPTLLYGSASAWYGFPSSGAPVNKTSTNSSAGSAYCCVGITFQIPSSVVSCQVSEVSMNNIRFSWGTSPAVFRIMDATGTTSLQSKALESAIVMYTQNHGVLNIMFDGTLATLTGGTTYLFVVEYQGADLQTYTYDFDTVYAPAIDNTFAGITGGRYYSRANTSALWTVATTVFQHSPITVSLADITMAGSGGGGLMVHPGMAGGIRG